MIQLHFSRWGVGMEIWGIVFKQDQVFPGDYDGMGTRRAREMRMNERKSP